MGGFLILRGAYYNEQMTCGDEKQTTQVIAKRLRITPHPLFPDELPGERCGALPQAQKSPCSYPAGA